MIFSVMTWNTKIKRISSWMTLFLLAFLILWWWDIFATSRSSSNVPNSYYANYMVEDDWNKLAAIFVDVDATTKIGQINWSATYAEQLSIMNRVFKYFPQDDYEFLLIYEQCKKTTATMAKDPSTTNFQAYNDKCKKPLTKLKNTIDKDYTVKVAATASPSSWPAPLTVTFDARGSKDPSNETIPSNKYFWYYRDIDGVDKTIWIWPVVKYQFLEAWTYIVHCTVRSSNAWVFDGTKNITVTVSPKSATVSVYANGKKMQKNKASKIGIQEANKWVLFDGSSTTPLWGREILSYTWNVTSRDWFKWTKSGDWSPSYINLPLPWQGDYSITLAVTDNEHNVVSETYTLAVSDPVAIVQQNPDKWNTSTTYSFSANASYSLTSRLKLYTWEIFDSEWTKMDTLQWKQINRQFKKPGNYTVNLTVEDEMWLKNSDVVNIYVDSTPPTPQFSITATNKWRYPSEFILDASASTDIDASNWYDVLSYEWIFSNSDAKEITETEDDNKVITVIFNEKWKHKVTLKVTDNYWQTEEITKEINVESILRPELTINPKATIWWEPVLFKVQTNVPVINYEWDFGNWTPTRTTTDNKWEVKYDKVGSYNVKVKVIGENDDSNEVTEKVFIWEKDSPIIWYEVRDGSSHVIKQNDVCVVAESNWTWTAKYDAFRVDRQASFTINTTQSVNAQGSKNNLKYYFQLKNDEILQSAKFSHKFNSLWCQYVDYTLEDTSLWKVTKERIWFKVVNALPKLNNLTLSYPQYGNEMGIWLQQSKSTNDIFSSSIDPIIIKVTAEGAIDTDWTISYYKWYYYPKSNPNKLLDTKITPWTISYAFFSVPRQAWEFMFWVKMFDNDDGNKSSEDILGNGPIIMFPPDTKQPDIPIVTLKSDKINVEVGEEVTFDIISKIISDRSDFEKERTIQIDFDWDWEYDLTTKNDRVKYAYTKASPTESPYTPIASVIYRDYRGIWEWTPIVVKTWLRPGLMYTAIGRSVIFKDISLGNIIEREICLDKEQCEKWNQNYINKSLDSTFKVTYPKSWTYTVSIKAKDSNGNEAVTEQQVTITDRTTLQPIDDWVFLVTLPEVNFENWVPSVFLSKQLNNQVMFYVKATNDITTCYVDSDINFDSSSDWDAKNDKDFGCNRMTNQTYTPSYESAVGRIYYQKSTDTSLQHKDFIVEFADYETNFDEETRQKYDLAKELIQTIDDSSSIANGTLRSLIVTLRNDIANGDKNARRWDVLQIEQFKSENRVKLTESQEEKLNDLISSLQDHATISALWGTPYEVSKEEILSLLPQKLKQDTYDLFHEFEMLDWETSGDTKWQRATILVKIDDLISKNAVPSNNIWENEIASDDYENIVKNNICKIGEEYDILLKICGQYNKDNPDVKIEPTTVAVQKEDISNSTWMPTIVKVLLWILGIVVFVFAWAISAFAIKAKLREKYENEED